MSDYSIHLSQLWPFAPCRCWRLNRQFELVDWKTRENAFSHSSALPPQNRTQILGKKRRAPRFYCCLLHHQRFSAKWNICLIHQTFSCSRVSLRMQTLFQLCVFVLIEKLWWRHRDRTVWRNWRTWICIVADRAFARSGSSWAHRQVSCNWECIVVDFDTGFRRD